MIKRSLLAVWILCPIGLLAWHFGPGEKHLARDRAGDYFGRRAFDGRGLRAASLSSVVDETDVEELLAALDLV